MLKNINVKVANVALITREQFCEQMFDFLCNMRSGLDVEAKSVHTELLTSFVDVVDRDSIQALADWGCVNIDYLLPWVDGYLTAGSGDISLIGIMVDGRIFPLWKLNDDEVDSLDVVHGVIVS